MPQGSVLGPILFLIYINDIDDNMMSKVLKFADDTKLISAVATDQDIDFVTQDLCNLASWSREWTVSNFPCLSLITRTLDACFPVIFLTPSNTALLIFCLCDLSISRHMFCKYASLSALLLLEISLQRKL